MDERKPLVTECNARSLQPWRTYMPTPEWFAHRRRVSALDKAIIDIIRARSGLAYTSVIPSHYPRITPSVSPQHLLITPSLPPKYSLVPPQYPLSTPSVPLQYPLSTPSVPPQ